MREGLALVAFTDRGLALAERLAARLDGSVQNGRETGFSLGAWTAEQFARRAALIFVSAAGIAVRAVGPLLQSKAEDPAVLSLDEQGRFVIPLVSGHLGGANALARQIAALTGGTAVISTATDLSGRFAVDLWAKKQGMSIPQPERIKGFSARLLAGETLGVACPWPVRGPVPVGLLLAAEGDAAVTLRPLEGQTLQLVPRVLSLGVGCRRDTTDETLRAAFADFCRQRRVWPQAIAEAASIDRKQDEAGLLAFCREQGWPLRFFSAEELAALEGDFSASEFVEKTVGVDNVCERAAVLASGGALFEKKYARDGVTFALAIREPSLDWSW